MEYIILCQPTTDIPVDTKSPIGYIAIASHKRMQQELSPYSYVAIPASRIYVHQVNCRTLHAWVAICELIQ